jgi:hypothetical protein
VDIQDTEEDARRVIRTFGITYPNGRDPKLPLPTRSERS